MNRSQKNIYILLAAIIIILIAWLYSYSIYSPYRISSQEAKRRIQNSDFDMILDVRTDLERETLGYYSGSVHIQAADLEKKLPALNPNKKSRILAYCNTGHRARLATEKLHKLGYENSVYISSTYKSLL